MSPANNNNNTPVRVNGGGYRVQSISVLCTSHFRLGPSDLFYQVCPLFPCLCFGP